MRKGPISPKDFEAKFRQCRNSINHSSEHREHIHRLAEAVQDDRAQQAADQIVADVLAGRRPSADPVNVWLRGGAVFWQEGHLSLGDGWPLSGWSDEFPELLAANSPDQAVSALRENWDDIEPFYESYGAIPIRASNGATATMISICSFASTDMPHRIVRSPEMFMRMVRLTGTLWRADFPNGDPMQASDEVLAAHLVRARRFSRL